MLGCRPPRKPVWGRASSPGVSGRGVQRLAARVELAPPLNLTFSPRATAYGEKGRAVPSAKKPRAWTANRRASPLVAARGSCPARLYFCSSAAGGMRPVFLIVAKAPGDERYWISNLAAAGSFAPEATPAANTVTF
jgi:hypothetical protein